MAMLTLISVTIIYTLTPHTYINRYREVIVLDETTVDTNFSD